MGAIQARPTGPTPPPGPDLDPILTRKGQFQVQIRSGGRCSKATLSFLSLFFFGIACFFFSARNSLFFLSQFRSIFHFCGAIFRPFSRWGQNPFLGHFVWLCTRSTGLQKKGVVYNPCPSFSLFFFGIPCFFALQGIPCFFERFSPLSQGFSGFGSLDGRNRAIQIENR